MTDQMTDEKLTVEQVYARGWVDGEKAEREACAALCEKIGYAYREEYDRVKNHGATGREAAGESLASAVTAIELGRVVRRRGKQ